MQLMPKQLVGNIGGQFLKDSKTVVFHPNACEALEALSKVMSSGFVSFFFRKISVPNFVINELLLKLGWLCSFYNVAIEYCYL